MLKENVSLFKSIFGPKGWFTSLDRRKPKNINRTATEAAIPSANKPTRKHRKSK
jgi:hypothetical protein